MTEKLKF